MADETGTVIGGVDTHGETHHAAVIDHLGRHLADHEFPAAASGYRQLLCWLQSFGQVEKVGVEGTGSYGAELARVLQSAGIPVVEVDRPDRKTRRRKGKSDPIDAYAAADAVLSARATGTPKARDGIVEAIRALRLPKRSAVKARTRTTFTQDRTRLKHRTEKLLEDAQIKLSTVVSDLFGVSGRAMMDALAIEALTGQFEDHHGGLRRVLLDTVDHYTRQIRHLDQHIAALLAELAGPRHPDLIARLDAIPGVGPVTAQVILAEIGLDMSRFPTPSTRSPGPSSARAPSSPGPRTPPGPPAAAIPGSREPSAKRPTPPPAPTPSSAPATAGSSNAGATPRRWSPSPGPSSSSPGIC